MSSRDELMESQARTIEQDETERAKHRLKRGLFRWAFIAAAVAAGLGAGAWLFL